MDGLSLLLTYADSFLGTPYVYNGKHKATGLDCSGFISEVLRSIGVVGNFETLNAQMLYDKFKTESSISLQPNPGDLLFFGPTDTKIDHVALVRDTYRLIESAGAGKECISIGMANAKGAMVRYRTIGYRKDFLALIKIKYPWQN